MSNIRFGRLFNRSERAVIIAVEPQSFQRALCDIVKRGVSPEEVGGKYNLID